MEVIDYDEIYEAVENFKVMSLTDLSERQILENLLETREESKVGLIHFDATEESHFSIEN